MVETELQPGDNELFESHFRNELTAKELVSKLVDIYLPPLLSFLSRYDVDSAEAQPLVQEALFRGVWYALHYKASKSFAAAVVMNLRRAVLASPYSQNLLRDQSLEPDTPESKTATAIRDFLERKISIDEMELLLANTVEGKTPDAIAIATGESLSVVEDRLNRLRAQFLRDLGLLAELPRSR